MIGILSMVSDSSTRQMIYVYEKYIVLFIAVQLSVFTHKEQCKSIRSYVAAGAEIIRCINESADFHPFLDFFHDVEGFFISICVGDTDNLFFWFYDIVADQGDQFVDSGFAAAAFFVLNDVAVLVSAENRFDT